MGSAPEDQLEAEGQGISNDAAQHKQHEYRVGLEEKLVWKSHLDQRHGCGNGEAKCGMEDHKCGSTICCGGHGWLCWKVVDQLVRAATVTCFAGITSSVFISFSKEKKDFIPSNLVRSAVNDDVPSVRSAACRAIGVRITASWAVANICDSIRHCIDDFALKQSGGSPEISKLFTLLTDCPLRLTKDGDKIKSNAVRALGNLSRSIKYTSDSDRTVDNKGSSLKSTKPEQLPSSNYRAGSQQDVSISRHPASLGDSRWLEKVVQAFISCVTTGNVKAHKLQGRFT
ncbi:hypothetical protein ACE6H2_007699 [Prunus campanulata]